MKRKPGRPKTVPKDEQQDSKWEAQQRWFLNQQQAPISPDKAQSDRIELLLNKVYSQGVALFSKIHNLEVQISTLKTQTAKTLALLATESELSEDERRAVLNDFVHQVTAKKK